ncbi:hypothetical protein RB195_013588 [Necator americanus]|uniref:Uncharacterized protein n=1 Tax=Necator americanus TaxID=51031 RepID=A0ABR1DZ12_NECAM
MKQSVDLRKISFGPAIDFGMTRIGSSEKSKHKPSAMSGEQQEQSETTFCAQTCPKALNGAIWGAMECSRCEGEAQQQRCALKRAQMRGMGAIWGPREQILYKGGSKNMQYVWEKKW